MSNNINISTERYVQLLRVERACRSLLYGLDVDLNEFTMLKLRREAKQALADKPQSMLTTKRALEI